MGAILTCSFCLFAAGFCIRGGDGEEGNDAREHELCDVHRVEMVALPRKWPS